MNCPACHYDRTKVTNTQIFANFNFRQRECLECGYKFQTTEAEISYDVLLNAAAKMTRDERKARVG